ncbi:MAG: glycosyltransferase family 39 protein [Elusimicrobia bacterium]|nr:glycosyltransferase family 39 protein [Elusimicrobiota bacterium]
MTKIFNLKNTIIFVFVSVLWKLFMSSVPLHSDEAYYWLWSKSLDLSYYDHAPMVAYFIKLTTLFCNNEIAVRFSSIIVTIILSFLLWKLVIRLFNNEAMASASIVILHCMPILFTASIIITPDTPVFLFLSLATYYVWKLIETKNVNYWYLIGLFFGLSMLSKYTACLFIMSLFIYIVLDKKIYWFKNYQLYIGILISVICFLPVIYWNWQHDWASFSYQIGHGLSNDGIRFNYIFEYLGTQAGVFNIILFFPILYIGIKYLFSKNTKNIFLAAFSVPVILFYVFTALKRLPGGNWPIPAYFTFSIIAAKYFIEGGKIKQRLVAGALIFNLVVSVIIGLHAKYTILPLDKISNDTAIADATNYFHGYKELAEKLLNDGYEFVVTPEHQLSSSIAYYTKNKIKTFRYSNGSKKTQFEIWKMPKDFDYSNGAFVYEPRDDGKLPCRIYEIFNLSPDVDNVKTIRNNNIARQYNIQKISK